MKPKERRAPQEAPKQPVDPAQAHGEPAKAADTPLFQPFGVPATPMTFE